MPSYGGPEDPMKDWHRRLTGQVIFSRQIRWCIQWNIRFKCNLLQFSKILQKCSISHVFCLSFPNKMNITGFNYNIFHVLKLLYTVEEMASREDSCKDGSMNWFIHTHCQPIILTKNSIHYQKQLHANINEKTRKTVYYFQ